MPSLKHEFLVDLFRQNPLLLIEVVRHALGVIPPPFNRVEAVDADVTELLPVEARADLVLLFYQDGRVVYALVVEIQLNRDTDKGYTWPVYWAVERARRRCPVGILVVALSEKVAEWAGRAITDGNQGGGTVKPLVLGPSGVPRVIDEAQAEEALDLAMMSLLAHADEPILAQVAASALIAIKKRPEDRMLLYSRVIAAVLNDAVRKGKLERQIMNAILQKYGDRLKAESDQAIMEWQRSEGEATGKAEGKAEGTLELLRMRGLPVDEESEARILACKDLEVIDRWFHRAFSVASVKDIFSE